MTTILVLYSSLANFFNAFAGTFTEDFTTDAFKDAVNTTADWNTTAGELRLNPFVPTRMLTANRLGV